MKVPGAFLHRPPSDGPRDPCRNSNEVAALFGFTSSKALHGAVHRGSFPPPDLVSGITHRKCHWKLSTLAAEQRRRESLK